MAISNMEKLPPGTQRIEDDSGQHILLAPQPNADPNQPLNWSTKRKTIHMTILSFYALMIFAILCVAVPLWQDFNTELNMSYDQLNNGYAANMAALSVGCVIFIPVAMKVGRRPVYIATAVIMLATCVWQGKMYTVGDMIGTNVVMGIAGAVNEALFQVTVSDLFFVHQRGTMNGIYLFVVLVGNYLGPVAAGYVAASQGWRWVFWYCTIFQAIMCVVMVFFLEESKYVAPAMLGVAPPGSKEDANKLSPSSSLVEKQDITTKSADNVPQRVSTEQQRRLSLTDPAQPNAKFGSVSVDATELAKNQHRRIVEIDYSIPMKTYRQRHSWWNLEQQESNENQSFWQHFWQPFYILGTFPGVMFAALQYGWVIACLAILAVTQAILYASPPYNFTTVGVGNMNLPPAIGAVLGSMFGGPLVDYFIVKVAKRRGGIYEPETRLWLFIVPGMAMPIGAFMYGLTIARGDPWIINAVGAGFIGFSIGGVGDISLTYVQDSYQYILGDALTGVVFVRNVIATGLVFAVSPWMENMGVYNMFVLLGCLGVAIALTCIPMMIWGRRFRAHFAEKYQYYAARQY